MESLPCTDITYSLSTDITTLVITDGTITDAINLLGNYTINTAWHFSDDGHGGTIVSRVRPCPPPAISSQCSRPQRITTSFSAARSLLPTTTGTVETADGTVAALKTAVSESRRRRNDECDDQRERCCGSHRPYRLWTGLVDGQSWHCSGVHFSSRTGLPEIPPITARSRSAMRLNSVGRRRRETAVRSTGWKDKLRSHPSCSCSSI